MKKLLSAAVVALCLCQQAQAQVPPAVQQFVPQQFLPRNFLPPAVAQRIPAFAGPVATAGPRIPGIPAAFAPRNFLPPRLAANGPGGGLPGTRRALNRVPRLSRRR